MATFAVILPAAGKSTRFASAHRKKPFAELQGRPVWVRAAEHFLSRKDVVQSIIVVSPDDRDWFREKFQANLAFMDIQVVEGGRERADSVERGLAHVRPDVEFVAVHDAARPLIVPEWIDRAFRAAEEHGAALLAVPVTSTVKRVRSGRIAETVPRADLWLAQTPQVFRRQLLLDAFSRRGAGEATDECQLVEQLGQAIHVVEGSPMNLKITTPEDFRMAEALLTALPREKLPGFLHPFADEEPRLL